MKREFPGIYNSWRGMRDRCNRPNRADAHCYSLKGIRYTQEWETFSSFKDWAVANGWAPGLTLDRINGDLGYTPENCRWADRKVQGRNLSKNRMVEFRGQVRCLSEWAEITGVRYANLLARITRLGWSVEKAFTTPNLPLFGGAK